MEGETQFLYNDKELAAVIKKFEKKKGKEIDMSDSGKGANRKDVITKELDLVEFYEADDLYEAIKKIEKLGLDIQDYHSASDKPKPVKIAAKKGKSKKKGADEPKKNTRYKLIRKDEEPHYAETLSEVLDFVQVEGKRGLSI